MDIRFDGKVAIVTGAGNGLGRSHALALAARGAKVVVNDLGGRVDGSGSSLSAAEKVVAEIKANGGDAIANGANVTNVLEVDAMVRQALQTWGRVDILINNAGILRDKSFAKVTDDDFKLVVDVHLMGAKNCSKAVWEAMKTQGGGTIVMTTSSSGLYGNFGQANYGAAKMGQVGLMNVLAIEGAKYNIKVNAISPCAATRMLSDLVDEQANQVLTVESVTAGLLFLASEHSPSKFILAAGAGGYASAGIFETQGIYLPPEQQTPENVARNLTTILDTSNQQQFKEGNDQTVKFVGKAVEYQKRAKQ
ncbi:SDR family NAD(P)-dependent oxidoreductase [Alteromonas sp. D210916BOD_24]|uniref:SDR family NAD(P)-dependent oxidoreductase n=1 Tax=Alteromonas sp. D210916BOD_24 TaxID=3157618 RepID=UPI00399C9509